MPRHSKAYLNNNEFIEKDIKMSSNELKMNEKLRSVVHESEKIKAIMSENSRLINSTEEEINKVNLNIKCKIFINKEYNVWHFLELRRSGMQERGRLRIHLIKQDKDDENHEGDILLNKPLGECPIEIRIKYSNYIDKLLDQYMMEIEKLSDNLRIIA
jgi:hypothetical protein